MSIYYVYLYLRSNYTPYYVGKGKQNRAYKCHRKHGISTPKDKSRIIFIKQDLSEIQALMMERYYIRWFGRKDNGSGILHNKTDGGESTIGYKHTEKRKKEISLHFKGNRYGCINKGKPKDKNHILKVAESKSCNWLIIDPAGKSYIIKNMSKFCRENNLNVGCMNMVSKNKLNQYKGWKCKKID